MSGHPRSCDEVKQELQVRHKPFIDKGWRPLPIGENAILHRLVRGQDIDPNTNKPSKSTFSNYGLSVLVDSENYPLDIHKCIEESTVFVGAVQISAQELEGMGYEVYLDPHPDPLGRRQHPNHAQVVCNKTPGKTKKIRDICTWSFHPKS